MKIGWGLVAAAICTAAAVRFASAADADDFSGTFIRTGPGTESDWQSTWVVTPCGPGCAHVADSTGWNADAHIIKGRWTFEVSRPDATKCLDGWAPGIANYSVDAARLDGWVVTTKPAPCALQEGYSTPLYFTLTRAG
ncbi:hypothetical protein MNVI_09280 [Mycobacterium noviomagense]|uniref:Secreted protein n=1 Tax=Mycobacterium noviomagense TaxID=459858 RepID=A0A7I7PAJ2_9MYCO|nr:hypothetical protein MNVI_09280 [Mycobacterium noviomagense]